MHVSSHVVSIASKPGVVSADDRRSAFALAIQRLAAIRADETRAHTEAEDVEMLPGVQDLIEGDNRRRASRSAAASEGAEDIEQVDAEAVQGIEDEDEEPAHDGRKRYDSCLACDRFTMPVALD